MYASLLERNLNGVLTNNLIKVICDKVFNGRHSDNLNQFFINIRNSIKELEEKKDYANSEMEAYFKKPQWEDVLNNVQKSLYFIGDENVKFKRFQEKFILSFENFYDTFNLAKSVDNFEKIVTDYLYDYCDLIQYLHKTEKLYNNNFAVSTALNQLMCGYTNCTEKYFYRFFSPLVIENLIISLIGYEKFLDKTFNGLSDLSKKMMLDMFAEKFSRMFTSNVTIDNQPCNISPDNCLVQKSTCRFFLSSIQMVRPIRWYGKISAYLDNWRKKAGNKKLDKLKVCVIGYVHLYQVKDQVKSFELEELCDAIEKSSQNDMPCESYEIKIYVNKNDFHFFQFDDETELKYGKDSEITIRIIKKDYTVLFLQEALNNVIDENDMLLILDAPNLYINKIYSVPILTDSNNSLTNYNKYETLNEEFVMMPRVYKNAPVHFTNTLMNNIANNINNPNRVLKYQMNEELINYLNYRISQKGVSKSKNKKVYILFSSTNSVANSEWSYKNIAREERYNGKAFRLIIFRSDSNSESPVLVPYQKPRNFMSFSLWNIIKNIDITLCHSDEMKKIIGEGNKFHTLSNIKLVLTWNGFEEFEISYFINNNFTEKQKLSIEKFIDEIFYILLNKDVETTCFCVNSAFANAIYSRIKYLDDAVFYCLFMTRNWRAINPKITVKPGDEDTKKMLESFLSFNQPERWIIVRALNGFQSESFCEDDFYTIHNELKKNKIDTRQFIVDVKSVCEKNNYTNSRLYRNIVHSMEF